MLLCTAPCISVNTLNSIHCAIGSQCSSRSAAVMLRWSRRSIQRTTRAAACCTISSRCSRVAVIPNHAAFPKSSVEVTTACTSVLHALSGRDDLICAILRNRPYAVRHMRVTCMVIDKVTDVGRRPDVTSTYEEEMVVPYDSVLQTVSLLSLPRLIAGIVTPTTLSRQ